MKAYLAQLEFQNKELDQFVYASSHDMKEPLRKIHLYNSYIAGNPDNQMDQKSREYLTRSIRAVGRMNRLIEDLLAYSRITNIKDGFERVDLNKLIDEIIGFRKEDIERKNITIHCESLPVINAIPFQINQLMSNLLDNAIKYNDPEKIGNIRIEAATVPAKALEVTTAPFREYYQISIKDNGIGFEADFTDKVFELFQRLPNTSDVKGSGIGLAICKKIVQNHNGFIKASGNPGVGATFSIYLPVE
jgi:signal transduction histidine kinase